MSGCRVSSSGTAQSAKRFVVSGAGGFVGSALVHALSARGPVLALDCRIPAELTRRAQVLETDLSEPLAEMPEFSGAAVIHAAAVMNARTNDEYWSANVTGTFNMLEFARRLGARHFVFFSTGGVYPYAPGRHHREQDPLHPIGFYGHTKHIGEQTARAFHDLHDLAVTCVRLFFPYGPGQRRGIVPLVARAVRDGGELVVNRGGAPRINPVHLDDLCAAIERILEVDTDWRVYNVCGDQVLSFLDLVRLFEQRFDRPACLRFTDEEQGDLLGDNSAIKRDTGWAPRARFDAGVDLAIDD